MGGLFTEEENIKSFWTTLPGILTGIAALITAIGGVWVIYNTTNDATLPTIESFGANPEQIVSGESSTLSWRVSDATDTTITPETRNLPLSGSMKVHPSKTTTYTLKASNKHGSTKATTVISVETNNVQANVPVIISFQASPNKIFSGENAILSWSVSGATSITITPDIGYAPLNGSRMVNPTVSTTYILTASNREEVVKVTDSIYVKSIDLPKIQSFDAKTASRNSTELSWSVSGATSVTITPEIGTVPFNGSFTVSPTQNTTYTLTATNQAGSIDSTKVVPVSLDFPEIQSFSNNYSVFQNQSIDADLEETNKFYYYMVKKKKMK